MRACNLWITSVLLKFRMNLLVSKCTEGLGLISNKKLIFLLEIREQSTLICKYENFLNLPKTTRLAPRADKREGKTKSIKDSAT